MFCPSCGKSLQDGAKFCPNCGHQMAVPAQADPAPVNPAAPAGQAAPAAKPEGKKKRSPLPFIIIGAIVVIAAAAAVLYFFVFRTEPVYLDLNDYVVMETEGYDGYGMVWFTLDTDRIVSDYADAKIKWTGTAPESGEPIDVLVSGTYIVNDYITGVSNGDVLTADIDISWFTAYETNLVVTYDPAKEFKVENLVPLTDLDPFEYFSCEVTGYEGGTETSYGFGGEDTELYDFLCILTVSYDCANDLQSLRNGDVITFTLDANESDLAMYGEFYGVNITNTSWTYTVDGLAVGSHYLTDSSEIPAEYYEELGSAVGDAATSWWESDVGDDNYSYELVGWAFAGGLPSDDYDRNNEYYVIIKGTLTYDGEPFSVYYYGEIIDLYYDAETGEYSFEGGNYNDGAYIMDTGDEANWTSGTVGDWDVTTYGLASLDDLVDEISSYFDDSSVIEWHLD